jgi:hypothetical protein
MTEINLLNGKINNVISSSLATGPLASFRDVHFAQVEHSRPSCWAILASCRNSPRRYCHSDASGPRAPMPAFGDIARNLLNRETNTILCDGITAEKMPSVPEALRDVAQRYHRFLQNRIGELEEAGIDISATLPQLTSSGGAVAFENCHVLNAELATFEILPPRGPVLHRRTTQPSDTRLERTSDHPGADRCQCRADPGDLSRPGPRQHRA